MSRDPGDELAQVATIADPGLANAAERAHTLGRYRLERVLGAGGMGIVHAALDVDLERRVAIKVLHAGGSEAGRARLLREARAMARLDHAGVVRIFEVDSIDGTDFVVMELVDGDNLAEWLRGGPRSQREIVDAFVAAGRGLAAAHAAGMVHRDFKPHNVLRSRGGRVLVSDFGLARDALAADHPASPPVVGALANPATTTPTPLGNLTATGALVGTPAYMAPEQWQGAAVGASADQFAFCVALWEALAGERPFRGATIAELRAAIERGVTGLDASKIPRRLRGVLARGLALAPAQRWPSMDALLAQLTRKSRAPIAIIAAITVTAAIAIPLALRDHDTTITPDAGFDNLAIPLGHNELIATIQKIDDTHYRVPRATVKQLLADRSELVEGAHVTPTMRDEAMYGWKLVGVRPRSVYAAFGLRDFDVVRSIDRTPATTNAALAAAYQRAQTAASVTIELERANRPIAITIAIEP